MLPILLLFLTALQTGALGVGGGTAPLAFIEHEAVTLHHWLTPAQFADIVVCCRVLPGGTLTGSSVMAACAAVLAGFALPAAGWTALAAHAKRTRTGAEILRCVAALLRPLAPGLCAAAAMLLMTADNFGSPAASPWQWGVSVGLFLVTLAGTAVFHINALTMVTLCGLAGCLLL